MQDSRQRDLLMAKIYALDIRLYNIVSNMLICYQFNHVQDRLHIF